MAEHQEAPFVDEFGIIHRDTEKSVNVSDLSAVATLAGDVLLPLSEIVIPDKIVLGEE